MYRLRNALKPVRRADALLALVERGDRTSADPEIRANPAEIVVHVDADTLAAVKRRSTSPRSHLEHGPHLAPETARRLACDGAIVALLERSSGEPLSIGRRTRAVPAPMRRALHARDGGCRFPGCTATHRLEAHHIHHWSAGGNTAIENLAELCPRHHALVHEGDYGLERLADGRLRFSRPDGHTIAACPRGEQPTSEEAIRKLEDEARSSGIEIDDHTCVPHWDGGSMDYAMAVEGLLWADGRMVT